MSFLRDQAAGFAPPGLYIAQQGDRRGELNDVSQERADRLGRRRPRGDERVNEIGNSHEHRDAGANRNPSPAADLCSYPLT